MVRLLTVVVPLTTMNTRPLLSASMVKPLPANVTLLRIMGKVLVNVMLLAKLMVLPASVASLLTAKMAARSSASLVTTIGLACHCSSTKPFAPEKLFAPPMPVPVT
jgi:hypothetical protein